MRKSLRTIVNAFSGRLCSLIVPLFLLITWLNADIYAGTKGAPPVSCNIQEAPCTLLISDREVTLDIQPKPVTAMKDLTFRVTLTGEQPSFLPHIDLGMPGMKMGPNRVVLREAAPGIYEGVGIIVRCPSGRRTWSATVTFPGLGEVTFIFDVIY